MMQNDVWGKKKIWKEWDLWKNVGSEIFFLKTNMNLKTWIPKMDLLLPQQQNYLKRKMSFLRVLKLKSVWERDWVSAYTFPVRWGQSLIKSTPQSLPQTLLLIHLLINVTHFLCPPQTMLRSLCFKKWCFLINNYVFLRILSSVIKLTFDKRK